MHEKDGLEPAAQHVSQTFNSLVVGVVIENKLDDAVWEFGILVICKLRVLPPKEAVIKDGRSNCPRLGSVHLLPEQLIL